MKPITANVPGSIRRLCATAILAVSALTAFADDTNCAAPPSGIVGWWRAEANALDSAGTNHGTTSGGLAYGGGRAGQAFVFNGSGAVVQLGNPPEFRLQDFTIEAWIKRSSTTSVSLNGNGNGTIFGFYLGGYGVYLDPNGHPALTKVGINNVTLATAITDTNYHHLAVTKSGSTVVFYIDGTAFAAPAYNPGFTFSTSAAIGGLGNDFSFLGSIDELAFYNRPLSGSEIASIYNAGAAGKCFTPVAPTITSHPTNVTVSAGDAATFRVGATGSQPLSYQWRRDGTNLAGATSSRLLIPQAQSADAGEYSVIVSNIANTATSSNAVLAVLPAPPCAPPAPGLVSWWRAEATALDEVGGNAGTTNGGVVYETGRVGQSFVFNGSGSVVQVGPSANLQFQHFTIETWLRRSSTANVSLNGNGNGVLFGFGIGGYGIYLAPGGFPALTKVGIDNVTLGTAITDTNFHHLAVTKNGSTVLFFIDGAAYPAPPYNQAFTFTSPAAIGGIDNNFTFLGAIDEVAVYSRALTTNEVQAIYDARGSGKCLVPIPPFISTQPTGRTVTVGSNTTFSVAAGGSVPLSYQWRFNGTNIANATTTSLTLTNVQMSQAGNYSVTVTNVAGATNSDDALLSVVFPPATLRVVGGSAASGGPVTLPVQLTANGNENALGFSLNFSTQWLAYAGVTLGSGAGGANLLLNTSQTASGRIGIAVALAANATLPAGTQEVVLVNFTAPVVQGSSPVTATITFGDVPTSRQLSTAQAQPLPASYLTGYLSLLPSDLEGDTVPRPSGDRTNSITDWVQVGRFAARLDTAADGGEFQRADCAPRSSLGNGQINVTDWVQSGRYAAGLDPLTAVGGPTSGGGPVANRGGGSGTSAARKVRVGDATAIQGLAGTLPVMLDSQGDENALGFTINFDATKFSYAGASLGSAAGSATLNVNSSQSASGQVGLVLSLPTEAVFAAGVREVAKVTLTPTASAVGSNPVGFTHDLVACVVSDPLADELTADFLAGTVSVNPLPTLLITRSGDSVTLTWPVWAADFALQSADGDVSGGWANVGAAGQTNGGNLVLTLPVIGDTKFFRLRRP